MNRRGCRWTVIVVIAPICELDHAASVQSIRVFASIDCLRVGFLTRKVPIIFQFGQRFLSSWNAKFRGLYSVLLFLHISGCGESVYADGSICLDILQNQWSPIYDVAAILTSIQVSWFCGLAPSVKSKSYHRYSLYGSELSFQAVMDKWWVALSGSSSDSSTTKIAA